MTLFFFLSVNVAQGAVRLVLRVSACSGGELLRLVLWVPSQDGKHDTNNISWGKKKNIK